MSKKYLIIGGIVLVLGIVIGAGFNLKINAPSSLGSVIQGSDYHSTTSSTGRFVVPALLQTGGGAFSSISITGTSSGVINIYDATTTNVNLRTGNTATSAILVATFPAGQQAGTYTFDALFYNGLIYDVIGTMPTATPTWRGFQ